MFRHENNIEKENESDDDDDDESDDEYLSDQFWIEGVLDIEKIKPVLDNFKKAVDNFEELLSKYSLKCKNCEFEAKDLNGLTMHMKAKHNKWQCL